MKVDTLLTVSDVARMCRVTTETIKNYVRLGKMPQPIKLTPSTFRWTTETIYAWLRAKNA